MRLKIALGAVAALALPMQLIPVTRTNPPVEGEIAVPDSVRKILTRACYDCHSHETHWPWYAYVAPVSWLVSKDVTNGRKHLNFSTWNRYDHERREKKLDEIWEEVEEGMMPLKIYLPLHSEARLSEHDHAVLHDWTMDALDALRTLRDSTRGEMP